MAESAKNGRARAPQAMRRIKVDLGDRSYPIRIGHDCLDEAGPAIARATGASKVAIVTVPGVGRRYAGKLRRSLEGAGVKVGRVTVPDGDASKNIHQLQRLYEAFIDMGLDRSEERAHYAGYQARFDVPDES